MCPLTTVPAPRRTPMFTAGTAESPPCRPVKPGFCFWRPGSVQQGYEECLNHGATYAWVLSVCEALLLRFGFVFCWLVCLFVFCFSNKVLASKARLRRWGFSAERGWMILEIIPPIFNTLAQVTRFLVSFQTIPELRHSSWNSEPLSYPRLASQSPQCPGGGPLLF